MKKNKSETKPSVLADEERDDLTNKDEANIEAVNMYSSEDDLDVPGAELDDEQEEIGSEDEENNYYSIGGDGHNDLEEDRD